MIVNQWFVFINGFRAATNTKYIFSCIYFLYMFGVSNRWSELYFIFWYLFVTTIGLNLCLALSGDVSIDVLIDFS